MRSIKGAAHRSLDNSSSCQHGLTGLALPAPEFFFSFPETTCGRLCSLSRVAPADAAPAIEGLLLAPRSKDLVNHELDPDELQLRADTVRTGRYEGLIAFESCRDRDQPKRSTRRTDPANELHALPIVEVVVDQRDVEIATPARRFERPRSSARPRPHAVS